VPKPSIPAEAEDKLEPMIWPSIQKYVGNDLYVGVASVPEPYMHVLTLNPGEHKQIGPYDIFYLDSEVKPLEYMAAHIYIKTADGKTVIPAQPGIMFLRDEQGRPIRGDEGQPLMYKVDETIPELKDENGHPGGIMLDHMVPGSRQIKLAINLPGLPINWHVPLAVTYKPWVNLVWTGVLISVMGILWAMVRRMVEARRNLDGRADELPELDTV
jgi:hypothetical protein